MNNHYYTRLIPDPIFGSIRPLCIHRSFSFLQWKLHPLGPAPSSRPFWDPYNPSQLNYDLAYSPRTLDVQGVKSKRSDAFYLRVQSLSVEGLNRVWRAQYESTKRVSVNGSRCVGTNRGRAFSTCEGRSAFPPRYSHPRRRLLGRG